MHQYCEHEPLLQRQRRAHVCIWTVELRPEILLQAVSEVPSKASAAIDAEGGGQGGSQGCHEGIPFPLWHYLLGLVVLLKSGIALLRQVMPQRLALLSLLVPLVLPVVSEITLEQPLVASL